MHEFSRCSPLRLWCLINSVIRQIGSLTLHDPHRYQSLSEARFVESRQCVQAGPPNRFPSVISAILFALVVRFEVLPPRLMGVVRRDDGGSFSIIGRDDG